MGGSWKWLAVWLALVAPAPSAWAEQVLIPAGQLLVTAGMPPLDHATLVIDGTQVRAVRPGFITPAEANLPADTRVIDLSNMFVMPGFIDLHVHLTGGGSRDTYLREPNEYASLVAARS